MEQIYSAMLDVMQRATELPAVPKSSEEGGQSAGQFKELLQQKREAVVSAQDDQESDSVVPSDSRENSEMEDGTEENLALAQELLALQFTPLDFVGAPVDQLVKTDAPSLITPAFVETVAAVEPEATLARQPVADTGTEIVLPAQTAGQPEIEQAVVLPETAETMQTPEQAQTQPLENDQTMALPEAVNPIQVSEQPQTQRQETDLPLTQSAVREEQPQKKETELSVPVEAPLFQEVESAPIKVAEPEAAYSTPEAGDLETQVGEKVLNAVETGDSRLEIQLEPETLGKVTVEIARFETGAVQVVLKAESLHTQSLLEKHLPNLQLLLADHGQKSTQVEIQHWQENQPADSHQNPYEGQNEGRGHRQQQERRQPARQNDSFLHQLRLGLIPLEEVS